MLEFYHSKQEMNLKEGYLVIIRQFIVFVGCMYKLKI
jgi:hypothetical protein